MKHFTGFIYDSVDSKNLGVTLVHVSGGLYEETLGHSVGVEKESLKDRHLSYLKNISRENVSFDLTMFLEDGVTEQKLDEIKSLFFVDHYREFCFSDNPGKVCYAMPSGEIKISHDGVNGYISLNMTTNSPYWFSPVNVFESNSSGSFEIINKGTAICYPTYEITSLIDFSETLPLMIKNVRTNEEMVIREMSAGETIEVDTTYEHIQSSLPNVYRYDKFNDVYAGLEPGLNIINVNKDVSIVLRYREIYL